MTELHRLSGVSKTTIFNMYHDKIKQVDYSVVDRICKALNCKIQDILVYVPDDGDL